MELDLLKNIYFIEIFLINQILYFIFLFDILNLFVQIDANFKVKINKYTNSIKSL